MPSLDPLPDPWQARLDEVWDELVDIDCYSRYDGEIRRDSQAMAEQLANETLQRIGSSRIASALFWSHYDEATDSDLGVLDALRYAARFTPD